jgi:hypothetical protein
MPIDPSPDGAGIRNKPVSPPFPQPTPDKEKGRDEVNAPREGDLVHGEEDLVTPESEQVTETTRPPLGN